MLIKESLGIWEIIIILSLVFIFIIQVKNFLMIQSKLIKEIKLSIMINFFQVEIKLRGMNFYSKLKKGVMMNE